MRRTALGSKRLEFNSAPEKEDKKTYRSCVWDQNGRLVDCARGSTDEPRFALVGQVRFYDDVSVSFGAWTKAKIVREVRPNHWQRGGYRRSRRSAVWSLGSSFEDTCVENRRFAPVRLPAVSSGRNLQRWRRPAYGLRTKKCA